MRKRMEDIREGETFLVSHGEYSDYGVLMAAKATRRFNPREAMEEYKSTLSVKDDGFLSEYEFAAWLAKSGLIEEVNVREWYLGDYGTFDMHLKDTGRGY